MSFFDKVTIIVPTYNRASYFRRLMAFLDGYGFPLNVVVADSSNPICKSANRQVIKNLSNLKVLYLNKSPKQAPYLKFFDAVNAVKTKYSVFCADDDFITMNGLETSVRFLDENSGYSVAEGRAIVFLRLSLGKRIFFWRARHVRTSLDSEDVLSRLRTHSLNYQATFYGVHRTKQLVKFFQSTIDSDMTYHPFGELLPSFLAVVEGKIKRLNIFYSARDKYTWVVQKTPRENLIQQFKDDGTFKRRYRGFRDAMAKEVKKKVKKPLETIIDKIDTFLPKYFDMHSTSKSMVFVKKLVPRGWIYVRCTELYKFVRLLLVKRQHNKELREIVEGDEEFKRIKEVVLRQ